jgi:hypothetical protein
MTVVGHFSTEATAPGKPVEVGRSPNTHRKFKALVHVAMREQRTNPPQHFGELTIRVPTNRNPEAPHDAANLAKS